MLRKTKTRLGVIATAAAMALAIGVTSPAYADPPSGFRDLVGTGSDTTQDVLNGLALVVPAIGSYNALPAGQIQTRLGGPLFNRPNGSNQGQFSLSASINDTGTRVWPAAGGVNITDQIDFARSSNGPLSTAPGTALTFIPFALDAVTYAVSAASDWPRDIALGSASQDAIVPRPFTLRNIYNGNVQTYVDSDFINVPIRALIPQTGSGTRSFWIGAMGGVGVATDLTNTVQEHNGTFVTQKGDIVPFSIAQYIAQGNHGSLNPLASVVERRGNVELGNIDTIKPLLPVAAGGVQLNADFPVQRLVFNVVETARLAPAAMAPEDVLLRATFAGPTSTICAATATIIQYGFGTIGSLCGNTTSFTQALRFS